MKYLLSLLLILNLNTAFSASKTPEKKHTRSHLGVSAGMATIDLPFGTFSDPGFTFNLGYFFLPKLSLNGHYFLTVAPSGASNMNGFGLQTKYYFYNTEASVELEHNEGAVRVFDRYFAYGSFQFIDRDIRTTRVNISFSGFGLSIGAGYKLDFNSSIGVDLLRANLQNPAGAKTQEDASFTNLSLFYTYLF